MWEDKKSKMNARLTRRHNDFHNYDTIDTLRSIDERGNLDLERSDDADW